MVHVGDAGIGRAPRGDLGQQVVATDVVRPVLGVVLDVKRLVDAGRQRAARLLHGLRGIDVIGVVAGVERCIGVGEIEPDVDRTRCLRPHQRGQGCGEVRPGAVGRRTVDGADRRTSGLQQRDALAAADAAVGQAQEVHDGAAVGGGITHDGMPVDGGHRALQLLLADIAVRGLHEPQRAQRPLLAREVIRLRSPGIARAHASVARRRMDNDGARGCLAHIVERIRVHEELPIVLMPDRIEARGGRRGRGGRRSEGKQEAERSQDFHGGSQWKVRFAAATGTGSLRETRRWHGSLEPAATRFDDSIDGRNHSARSAIALA